MGKWDKYKKKDKVKKDEETVDTPNKTQKAIANCDTGILGKPYSNHWK